MGIALDTSSQGTRVTTGTTQTWSHTCTGSDRILFVETSVVNPTGITTTGITYNGVAMTLIGTAVVQANARNSLWMLENPASGANDIVITASTTITGRMDGGAASYTGATQSGGPDSSNAANGTGTTPNLATTVVDTDCWVVGGCFTGGIPIASTGVTERESMVPGSIRDFIGDSNGAVSTGSYTMNWTSANDNWGVVLASFAPAVAAPSQNSNFLALMA